MLILFGIFFLLLILKVPVGFSMFGSSLMYMIIHRESLEIFTQRIAAGPNSFPLLAVAFFILAGSIMNSAGITKRIFDFAGKIVGHYTGGLGHANILASIIFSGMSGSAIADAGGLGAIEIHAMKEAGYDEDFSVAVTGASSIIGPIIPPSIPAVLFGVAGGVSIGKLFAAGVIPGLIMAIAISVLVYFYCKKKNYSKAKHATIIEILIAFKKAFFPLLTPVIILGGIIFGVFTPTEAAIIAVFYALLLGFVYKEITLKDLPKFLGSTLNTTVGILFIIASASIFGWILTTSQVPQLLAATLLTYVTDKSLALLLLIVFLLIVGCFMETTAAILILVPILLPIYTALGMDPVHFGIIFILVLMIGLLTPPVGVVLYVLSSITKVPFERISKLIIPYVIALTIVVLILLFVPALVMFLPNLFFS